MYSDSEYKYRRVVGLIITFVLLFSCFGYIIYQYCLPVVTLKIDPVTIRQDEALPEFVVHAEFDGKEDIVLDEGTGYTVQKLVDELNQGKGFQVNHRVDNTKEGSYIVNVELEQQLKDKLLLSWNDKVKYQIESGVVTVLSKYGDWENGKFKMLDGTYASGWTNLGEDTYYFNEHGIRVTGKQEIAGNTYYFKRNGLFDTEKNPVNPNRPMIALTFDDGPGQSTERLLEFLQVYNARATFFMLGPRVNAYPEAVRKMVEAGCELGNHTTNHLRLTDYAADVVAGEINVTKDAIYQITGQTPTMVRPPYGAANETVQSVAEAPLVLWSVDTLDWQTRDASLISEHILNYVKDGDIILMHDIYPETVQAIIETIPVLQQEGYQIVTVSEMARARGITLENGVKYYNFHK